MGLRVWRLVGAFCSLPLSCQQRQLHLQRIVGVRLKMQAFFASIFVMFQFFLFSPDNRQYPQINVVTVFSLVDGDWDQTEILITFCAPFSHVYFVVVICLEGLNLEPEQRASWSLVRESCHEAIAVVVAGVGGAWQLQCRQSKVRVEKLGIK